MKQRFLDFPGTVSKIFFEMQIFKYVSIKFLFCSNIVHTGRDIRLNKS